MKSKTGIVNGKLIVLTGGAGELGRVATESFLRDGARVVVTGRSEAALGALVSDLRRTLGLEERDLDFAVMDGADPKATNAAAAAIAAKHGPIHALINNAGSAGPRRKVGEIPLYPQMNATSPAEESLVEACNSILGTAWITTLAFKPYFASGASIVNVSTIFSKVPYYGRAPYVVPKSALNALSMRMAVEFGADSRAIRVNTVLPGPIESERIHRVFTAMDTLKNAAPQTTRREMLGRMLLTAGTGEGQLLSKQQVAATLLFLASDASSGLTGQEFEVANGLKTDSESRALLETRPDLSSGYFDGGLLLLFGRANEFEASRLAERFKGRGARTLLLLETAEAAATAQARFADDESVQVRVFHPLKPEAWSDLSAEIGKREDFTTLASFVLSRPTDASALVSETAAEDVLRFIDQHIVSTVAYAQGLDRVLREIEPKLTCAPSVVFVSEGSPKSPAQAEIEGAATEALLRTWRNESRLAAAQEQRTWAPAVCQLLRYGNREDNNLDLSWEWMLSACMKGELGNALTLQLSPSVRGMTSDEGMRVQHGVQRGVHMHRTAIITGGSEGIGGEITRQLVLSGARIVVAERSTEKLERAWLRLTGELRQAGFRDPEARLLLLPNSDVTRPDDLAPIISKAVQKFGRVDYVINNAGLVGGECMVVDMAESVWRQTIQGNFLSNYQLLKYALPHMKKQGSGHVINMSSYFGGARHGATVYTNRADYAVSKAAQQVFAEAFAYVLGPDVQINAVAPGPVDGARLNGTYGRPGLYARRGRLIVANKRLNQVYSATSRSIKEGASPEALLRLVAKNTVVDIIADPNCPPALRGLCEDVSREKGDGLAKTHLLTSAILHQLLGRLTAAGELAPGFDEIRLLESFREPGEPFFDEALVEKTATGVRDDVLRRFALRRMPNDSDLATEIVSTLVHRTITGETLFPTCGFKYEGLRLGNRFRFDGADLLHDQRANGASNPASRTPAKFLVFSDSYFDETARIVSELASVSSTKGSDTIVVLTKSELSAAALKQRLKSSPAFDAVEVQALGERSPSRAIDDFVDQHGTPNVLVSLPMGPCTTDAVDADGLPTVEAFNRLIEETVTHQFLVAKRASLLDGCRVVLVSPFMESAKSPLDRALIELIRGMMRPLTLAAGKEATFLPQKAVFYQFDQDSVEADLAHALQGLAERVEETALPAKKAA